MYFIFILQVCENIIYDLGDINCICVTLVVMHNADHEFTYFIIKMHYGGLFKGNRYIESKVAYYDYCDHEKMSWELDDIGEKLTYTLPFGFNYKNINYYLQWVLHDIVFISLRNA